MNHRSTLSIPNIFEMTGIETLMVLATQSINNVVNVLVVVERLDKTDWRYQFHSEKIVAYKEVNCVIYKIEFISENILKKVRTKIVMNSNLIPGNKFIGALRLRIPKSIRFIFSSPRTISRFKKSPSILNFFIQMFFKIKLPFSFKFGKSKKSSASFLSDSEIDLLNKIYNWEIITGEKEIINWCDKIHLKSSLIQIVLQNYLLMERCAEDINGQLGVRMSSTVLYSCRMFFQQILKSVSASKGMLNLNEINLIELNLLSDGFLGRDIQRGLFPNLKLPDEHIKWCVNIGMSMSQVLRKNWKINLALEFLSKLSPSNSDVNSALCIEEQNYQSPSYPKTLNDLGEILQKYSTSVLDLIKKVPVIPENSVLKISGSISMGFGHPRSDIDLVLFTKELPNVLLNTLSITDGQMECKCGVTPSGHSICVEYFSESNLANIENWLINLRSLIIINPADKLQISELKEVLCTLKDVPLAKIADKFLSGILLHSAEMNEQQWSNRIRRDEFLSFFVLSNYVDFICKMDLAQNLFENKNDNRILFCSRLAFESLVIAYLALNNHVVWSKRWILEHLFRLNDKEAYELSKEVLFPTAQLFHSDYYALVKKNSAFFSQKIVSSGIYSEDVKKLINII